MTLLFLLPADFNVAIVFCERLYKYEGKVSSTFEKMSHSCQMKAICGRYSCQMKAICGRYSFKNTRRKDYNSYFQRLMTEGMSLFIVGNSSY